jgi:radical SAM protein with 4Fe4S-binding SPASM domain
VDCPRIPEITYSDFGEQLRKASRGKRIPWTGNIELTARCNLRCTHCYINVDERDEASRRNELTCAEACSLIDQVADNGCLCLLLTGGEPFVRSDTLDIFTHAKKKGLIITLFTNGTLITPRIADYLKDWPPHRVEISVYGITEQTYSAVTGVKGAFSQCIRGIELLLDRGLNVELKTMVLTSNEHELPEIESFARERGLAFRFDAMVNMRLDGGLRPGRCRLSPEHVVAIDMGDKRRREAWRDYAARYSGPPREPERLYRCAAGSGNFHIDSFARLSPCIVSRTPSFDLRRGSFTEGWEQFLPRVFAQKRTRVTSCRTCEISALCDQCPGNALLECGHPETPIDYLCRIAHLRARALDMEPREKERGNVSRE